MDKRFILEPSERCPITVLDDVKLVRLPMDGQVALKSVKKRARLPAGGLIAVHNHPERGDLHAPFDCVVKEVTSAYVEMEYDPLPPPAPASAKEAEEGGEKAADAPPAPVEPVSFDGLDKAGLCSLLKSLGVSTRLYTKPCELFIINCINPEPGLLYTHELLLSRLDEIKAGFALLRRLSNAQRYIFAVPDGVNVEVEGASVFHAKPVYPMGLRLPLIKSITGHESEEQISIIRLHNLFRLGLVARSGLPLTQTVLTVLGKNLLVPLGTPVETLFELAQVEPEEGDSVILGGLMRGRALSSLKRGVSKKDEGLQLAKKNSMPDLEDNPCFNCGACVMGCPMRLRPNMLSRYAETRHFEGCRKEGIDICIECGLCGYYCPACRPMQQYFRMAKFNLGIRTLQHVQETE